MTHVWADKCITSGKIALNFPLVTQFLETCVTQGMSRNLTDIPWVTHFPLVTQLFSAKKCHLGYVYSIPVLNIRKTPIFCLIWSRTQSSELKRMIPYLRSCPVVQTYSCFTKNVWFNVHNFLLAKLCSIWVKFLEFIYVSIATKSYCKNCQEMDTLLKKTSGALLFHFKLKWFK